MSEITLMGAWVMAQTHAYGALLMSSFLRQSVNNGEVSPDELAEAMPLLPPLTLIYLSSAIIGDDRYNIGTVNADLTAPLISRLGQPDMQVMQDSYGMPHTAVRLIDVQLIWEIVLSPDNPFGSSAMAQDISTGLSDGTISAPDLIRVWDMLPDVVTDLVVHQISSLPSDVQDYLTSWRK